MNSCVPVGVGEHGDRSLAVKRNGCDAWSARRNPGNTWQDLGTTLLLPEVHAWHKELHRAFERLLADTILPERPITKRRNASLSKRNGKWPVSIRFESGAFFNQ